MGNTHVRLDVQGTLTATARRSAGDPKGDGGRLRACRKGRRRAGGLDFLPRQRRLPSRWQSWAALLEEQPRLALAAQAGPREEEAVGNKSGSYQISGVFLSPYRMGYIYQGWPMGQIADRGDSHVPTLITLPPNTSLGPSHRGRVGVGPAAGLGKDIGTAAS